MRGLEKLLCIGINSELLFNFRCDMHFWLGHEDEICCRLLSSVRWDMVQKGAWKRWWHKELGSGQEGADTTWAFLPLFQKWKTQWQRAGIWSDRGRDNFGIPPTVPEMDTWQDTWTAWAGRSWAFLPHLRNLDITHEKLIYKSQVGAGASCSFLLLPKLEIVTSHTGSWYVKKDVFGTPPTAPRMGGIIGILRQLGSEPR